MEQISKDRICDRCNGEGVIEKNFRATETALEYDAPVVCSQCNGTGVDKGFEANTIKPYC